MIDIDYSEIGTEIETLIDDKKFKCEIIEKPFFWSKKNDYIKKSKIDCYS